MTDAIVIGGGVMGLAAARELRRRGHTVTLLERAQPGRAASWASAGIIGATLRNESDPSYHLRRVSRELWPAFAEAVHGESGMDPEYREMGCLQLASNADELAALQFAARRQADGSRRPQANGSRHPQANAEARNENAEARGVNAEARGVNAEARGVNAEARGVNAEARGEDAEARGEDRLELLDSKQLRELEPTLNSTLAGGLLVPGGNVDNRRLCKALEIAVRRAGVQIETGVEVTAIATTNGKVRGVEISPTSALSSTRSIRQGSAEHTRSAVGHGTDQYRHAADLVVLAAGAWSATIRNLSPTPPVAPQRGQILALDQSRVGISHVLLTPGDPYFVPRCDGQLVIGATREEAGWDPSLTAGGIAWLLNRAMQVVPALKECPIAEMWTGFRPASADGLPLIGKGALDGLYFLTGHGPSGIAPLPGSIALLMALMFGEQPPLPAEAFDPLRFERAAVEVRS
jgi:glycine oxidase